jgi:hypothetical protein
MLYIHRRTIDAVVYEQEQNVIIVIIIVVNENYALPFSGWW